MRTIRRMRGLGSDQRGASVVELAVAAPMLTMLLLGTYDVANGFVMRLRLEQAAQRVSELAIARRPVGTDVSYLVDEAKAVSGQPQQNVTVDLYLECDGVRQASYSSVCAVGQMPARYVDVRIRGTYDPLFDFASFRDGGAETGGVSLLGDSSVRLQ